MSTHPQPGAQPTAQPQTAAAPPRRIATTDLLSQILDNTEYRQEFGALAKQLVEAELSRDAFDQDWRLAKTFQMSGQFKDLKKLSEEQAISTAMAKIRLGRGWGLNETEAMAHVYFINGVPSVGNEAIAARLMEKGYAWDIIWEEKQANGGMETTGCTLLAKRQIGVTPGGIPQFEPIMDGKNKQIQFHFGDFEASRTEIYEDGKQIRLSEKWNYKAWRRDMYFWRCIARYKRQLATNVMSGARFQFEAEELAPVEMEQRGEGEYSQKGSRTEAALVAINHLVRNGTYDAARKTAKDAGISFDQFEPLVAEHQKQSIKEQGSRKETSTEVSGETGTKRQVPPITHPGSEENKSRDIHEELRGWRDTFKERTGSEVSFYHVLLKFGFKEIGNVTAGKFNQIESALAEAAKAAVDAKEPTQGGPREASKKGNVGSVAEQKDYKL